MSAVRAVVSGGAAAAGMVRAPRRAKDADLGSWDRCASRWLPVADCCRDVRPHHYRQARRHEAGASARRSPIGFAAARSI